MTTTRDRAEPTSTTTPEYVDIDDLAHWLAADRDLTRQLDDLALKTAEITKARDTVRSKIQERIGEAPQARVNGIPVISWAYSKPGSHLDQKQLKADHPDLVDRYMVPSKAARKYVLLDPEDTL